VGCKRRKVLKVKKGKGGQAKKETFEVVVRKANKLRQKKERDQSRDWWGWGDSKRGAGQLAKKVATEGKCQKKGGKSREKRGGKPKTWYSNA